MVRSRHSTHTNHNYLIRNDRLWALDVPLSTLAQTKHRINHENYIQIVPHQRIVIYFLVLEMLESSKCQHSIGTAVAAIDLHAACALFAKENSNSSKQITILWRLIACIKLQIRLLLIEFAIFLSPGNIYLPLGGHSGHVPHTHRLTFDFRFAHVNNGFLLSCDPRTGFFLDCPAVGYCGPIFMLASTYRHFASSSQRERHGSNNRKTVNTILLLCGSVTWNTQVCSFAHTEHSTEEKREKKLESDLMFTKKHRTDWRLLMCNQITFSQSVSVCILLLLHCETTSTTISFFVFCLNSYFVDDDDDGH